MTKLFPVVVLAGGLGTRVASITNQMPKALIPIQGEPFISHQLKLLSSAGFKEVVMCVGYLGEKIVDFVKDGSQFDLKVSYQFDGDRLLGTGGAIKSVLSVLPDHFFVTYGDSFLMCDYAQVQNTYTKSKKLALMTIYKNNNQYDTSNVEYDGLTISHYSKKNKTEAMHYIDYGLSVFSQNAFLPFIEKNYFDLSQVHEYLIEKNELAAFEVSNRFFEIGSIEGVKEFEKQISKEKMHELY